MKKFCCILLIIFSTSPSFADVYYCAEDARTGFDTEENFKIQNFKPIKFSIKIDLLNYNIASEEIFFLKSKNTKYCTFDRADNTLYCMNPFGQSFSYNDETRRFFLSSVYNKNGLRDDATISYGKCEKF